MPLRDLRLQHLIHQLVLFDHCQALEFRGLNLNRIHRAAAAADVLNLGSGSACHSHSVLCPPSDATVASFGSALSVCRYYLDHPVSDAARTCWSHHTLWYMTCISTSSYTPFANIFRRPPKQFRSRTSSFVGSSSPLILLKMCNSASFRKSGGFGAPLVSALYDRMEAQVVCNRGKAVARMH